MPKDNEYKIPLGLCKQAVMKLDSFMTDINEIREEEGLTAEDKQTFERIAEITGTILAAIVNIVTREMGEEEFLSEDIAMDEIDRYPE